MSNDKKYHADGTICMHFGDGGNKRVTFIPDRYVEQGGCQFVVFVPQADECQSAPKTTPALVVKAKDVPLLWYPYFKGKEALLLQAAVSRIKVTVVVSPCANGILFLKEIVIPAVPASPTTR